jgi:hypothetical protein
MEALCSPETLGCLHTEIQLKRTVIFIQKVLVFARHSLVPNVVDNWLLRLRYLSVLLDCLLTLNAGIK